MMWNCTECGCQNIAPDLEMCPQCFKYRPKETPAEPSGTAEEGGSAAPSPRRRAKADSAPQGQVEVAQEDNGGNSGH